jgi:dTDP-4-amino-4,6-dideoxygalactose transaminase
MGFSAELTIEDGAREVARAIRDGQFGDCSDSRYHSLQRTREIFELPATRSGEPTFSSFLPFALPSIGPEEEQEVLATLRSGWLTTGPRVKRFEQLVAEYVGARHAVAVSSCTAALHLSLAALDIGPGDEVLVPAITFPSTANAVLYQGARPVLVDVDPETLNIDLADAARRITPRTRAIMPVHMAGQPCDMDGLYALAASHDLKIVEDAAHALGATYRGHPVGSLAGSAAACFSFYPIKNMTTIEGGVIATDDDELAERARLLSLHGISKDAWARYGKDGSPHWEALSLGFKYNMSDVQAAIGIPQLAKLEGFLAARERYARIYREALADVDGVSPLEFDPTNRHAWHLFIVRINQAAASISRDELIGELAAENVATGVHFRSLHLQPLYQERLGYRRSDLPAAAAVSDEIMSLPLYPKMTESDVLSVVEAIRKVVRYRSSHGNRLQAAVHTNGRGALAALASVATV